ncbi:unnamed protein product [marine sediment metagenome]|uniref:Uncharacterized protein n=1 Tax=marine sediment metagenome TaxID=412755 RepID=X1RM28_9ZZZZ
MTKLINHPALALKVSQYPNYAQGLACLRNFLRGGRRAFFRNNGMAYFRHSSSLRIIVIRLVPHVYEVRAFPVGYFNVYGIKEALAVEEFRGWLFVLDPRTGRIYYMTGSQKEGVEFYKLIRLAIRHKGTLTKGGRFYQVLLRSSRATACVIAKRHKVTPRKLKNHQR